MNDFDEAVARREQRSGAARERRRIRRLIAPHLDKIRKLAGCHRVPFSACPSCHIRRAIRAIDAATRAPKKGRTK